MIQFRWVFAFLLSAGVSLPAPFARAAEKVVLAHALPALSASFAIASSLPTYLGYWKEEGLDVEVVTNRGAAAAVQLVIGGKADLTSANPGTAITAVQKGEDLVIFYTSLRGDIFGIAFPEGSGLKEIKDLKGKTIGVSSFASGGNNYIRTLLAQAGLKAGVDADVIEVGVGGRAAAAVKSKQVNALSLWDEAYAKMESEGIRFTKVVSDPRARYHLAGSMTTKRENLTKRRKMLVGMARGLAKAQLFQETNPEAAVRIHWKVYSQSSPRGGVTDEAVRREAKVISVRRGIQSKDAFGTGRYGDVPKDKMGEFQEYLLISGLVKQKMDVNRFYTDELIPEINRFDAAAVVQRAKAFTKP
ncbi:MAG: ABC transporter substrate-binding protein [Candidatus Tectomicrobia bacterium]|nr:ABC transporter substrate-binding protein [Candidatus Tectomicrobia bacterium]